MLIFKIFLSVVVALVTWLLLLKLIRRFWKFPIPAVLTNLIDNPVRRKMQSPKTLADRMRLQPEMHVLEVGPGKGSYTFEVAKRVPRGKVVTVDIQDSIIRKLEQRCLEMDVTNVEPRIANIYSLDFEDESFNRVFLIACLPEIPEPIRGLRELNRVLKPDGLLCLAEIFIDPDYPLPRTEIEWAKDAGFKLEARYGSLFVYHLNFSKQCKRDKKH